MKVRRGPTLALVAAVAGTVLEAGVLAQCRDSLAHLAGRLPPFADSGLSQIRQSILTTRIADVEAKILAQGLPPGNVMAMLVAQSSEYDKTMRDSRECAVKTFAGQEAALARALDARAYEASLPGAPGDGPTSIRKMVDGGANQNMLGACLRAFIAADMAKIANDETAALLRCRSLGGIGGGAAGGGTGGGSLPGGGLASPSSRNPGGAAGSDSVADALEQLRRQLHENTMAKASPEVAAYLAQQEAQYQHNQAALAATSAGQAQGTQQAKKAVVEDRFEMVSAAVRGWRPPTGYAAQAAPAPGIVQDPFAPPAAAGAAGAQESLAGTGLEWDAKRQIAFVPAAGASVCGGRLKAGDYPVLPDGNPLNNAERVREFISSCAAGQPVIVVRPDGTLEIRR